MEAHAKAIWLRLGLGEGRTEPAAEGGLILSPDELRLPGTQTYKLDKDEEQKEMAVLMTRAVRVGSMLEEQESLGYRWMGIPGNMQKTQCGLQERSFLRSEVWTEGTWEDRA